MQGDYYAKEQASEFWNKLAANDPAHQQQFQSMSNGAIGTKPEPLGEPTADQVSAKPPGGPQSMTLPLSQPFATWAPDPTVVPGHCQKNEHWQPDPYNLMAGSCQPNGPSQQPQPTP